MGVLAVGAERLGVDHVVGDDIGQLLKPEVADLREHDALVGDRRGQDHVERREAVGGDDKQLAGAVLVDVANLAARDELPLRLARLIENRHSCGPPSCQPAGEERAAMRSRRRPAERPSTSRVAAWQASSSCAGWKGEHTRRGPPLGQRNRRRRGHRHDARDHAAGEEAPLSQGRSASGMFSLPAGA